MAIASAAADNLGIPLATYLGEISGSNIPCPMMNILNGGQHADNNINIQEFMVVPIDIKEFPEKIRACSEIYYSLKNILKEEKETESMNKIMKIEGMMCGHCEATVKKALEALPQVDSAEVSHSEGTAVVRLRSELSDETLKKTVEDKDYKVTDIQ